MSVTTGDSMPRRPGMTLIEIMVAVAIVIVLVVIATVASRAAIDSARKGSAKSAMRMITMAIEEYSRFWPAANRPNHRATAGFPEWDFCYLWDPTNLLEYDVSQPPPDDELARDHAQNDVNEPNECLAYSLLAGVGGGPYLKKPPGGMVVTTDNTYPKSTPTLHRQRLVDPWNTPYAYQWLDGTGTPITQKNPSATAVRVRIISAGPDGMFGNTGPTASDEEKAQAEDNIYAGPEPGANDTLFP